MEDKQTMECAFCNIKLTVEAWESHIPIRNSICRMAVLYSVHLRSDGPWGKQDGKASV